MAYDLTTEAIAHFIGDFDQIMEDPRSRTTHEAFDGEQPDYPDAGGLHNVTIRVSVAHDVIGFDPGIAYSLQILPLPGRFVPVSVYLDWGSGPGFPPLGLPLDQSPLTFMIGGAFGQGVLGFVPSPPSSFATIIFQQNMLSDSDSIFGLEGPDLVDPDAQALALHWLTQAAEQLAGPPVPEVPDSGSDIAVTARQIHDQATGFKAGHADGATVHVLTGADVAGTHVNGVTTDDAPQLDAALPDHSQPEDEDGPQHKVITGGNTIVNQAHITMSLTDAPVIAVMGNSLSMTSISQVNVISDLDTIDGMARQTGPNDNTMTNVATALSLSARPEAEPTGTDDEDPDDSPTFPGISGVVRISGDVVNLNQLQQHNYIVDNDIVSMELSASRTFIQSGENLLVNAVSLAEFTYLYDLIVVAGDIINVSIINQMNVLLDDDFLTYPADEAWTVTGSHNVLWNEATIRTIGQDSHLEMPSIFEALGNSLSDGSDNIPSKVISLDAFEGISALNVLYIEGDLISLQIIDQFNLVADSDQVNLATAQPAVGEMSVVTGANALANIASISEYGSDSSVYTKGDIYSDALMHQAGLIVTDENQLIGQGEGGLVTEAVVFLMDTPAQPPGEDGGPPQRLFEDDMGHDPMGGMVA